VAQRVDLARRLLASVVLSDDGVVPDADHRHAVQRGAQVGVAGLGPVPAGLRIAVAAQLALLGMDTGVESSWSTSVNRKISPISAMRVAAVAGPTPGMLWRRPGDGAVEEAGEAALGL
jgi:hypothetical protein